MCDAEPFWVPDAKTFDRIGASFGSGSTGTVRLGLYASDADGFPLTRSLDAGVISATASSVVEAVISYAATPGLYWITAVKVSGSPVFDGVHAAQQPLGLGG